MVSEPLSLEPLPHVEVYKRHVDRTLLRQNLRLDPQQRLEQLQRFVRFLAELRRAAVAGGSARRGTD